MKWNENNGRYSDFNNQQDKPELCSLLQNDDTNWIINSMQPEQVEVNKNFYEVINDLGDKISYHKKYFQGEPTWEEILDQIFNFDHEDENILVMSLDRLFCSDKHVSSPITLQMHMSYISCGVNELVGINDLRELIININKHIKVPPMFIMDYLLAKILDIYINPYGALLMSDISDVSDSNLSWTNSKFLSLVSKAAFPLFNPHTDSNIVLWIIKRPEKSNYLNIVKTHKNEY